MKSMLIIASLIAVALAGPAHRGLVVPGPAGPAPVIEESPIAVGPAVIDGFEQVPPPIAVLPVEGLFPVNPSPVIDVPAADGSPLVQIIVNIKSAAEVIAPAPAETPVVPEVITPGPVNVVDNVIDNVDAPVVPEPVVIGTPELPEVSLPGPINVVDNVESAIVPEAVIVATPELPLPVNVVDNVVPVVVEPVIVGTPIIPAPVVVLPEALN